MLVNFRIKNFGTIREEQTISFIADKKNKHLDQYYTIEVGELRLLKLIFLYGANASGKTTILQALDFLHTLILRPNPSKKDYIVFEPYLLDSYSRDEDSELEVDFIHKGIRFIHTVVFNKRYIVKETLKSFHNSKRGKTIVSRTTDTEKQLAYLSFHKELSLSDSHKQILQDNTLWNTSMLSSFFKVNIDFSEFRDVTDWFAYYLQSLIMPRTGLTKYVTNQISEGAIRKEKLVQIMKQADFFISDIKLKIEEKNIPNDVISFLSNIEELPNELKTKMHSEQRMKSIDLSFEHENEQGERYDLPFKFESMGTQRFFGLAGILYLMLKSSSLFPIDELESSLHPDLFEYFVLTFLKNAKHSQCLVTTHNREILNNRDLFRNDAVWIVDKSLSSSAELYSLSEFDSSVIRNTSNIFNAYKAGRLGGVPNVGDHYINIEEL